MSSDATCHPSASAASTRLRAAARCLALAVVVLAWTAPVGAQAPLDIFASHSGASRRPAIANQWWVSATALLLTEFDGRFADPDRDVYPEFPEFLRHADLRTSVGYNYLTYGRNRIVEEKVEKWLGFLPANSPLTVAWSLHAGATKDTLVLAQGQAGLHDFRGVTHNYRPRLEEGYLLLGIDVEALLWPGERWYAFGGHASFGTFHSEQGLTAIASDRSGRTKSYLALTTGRITTAGTGPAPVTDALDSFYWSLRGSIEHTDRYGVSIGYSEGIFPNEPELLISLHVAVQLDDRLWLRIEHVNDLAGSKDRGFSGGLRIALAQTL